MSCRTIRSSTRASPGKSHDHTFVGNTSTDASSTLASLQAAGTTCQRPSDKAAYWMPTLIVDGAAGDAARRDDLLPAQHDVPGAARSRPGSR